MGPIFSVEHDLAYALLITAAVGLLHNLSVTVWAISKVGPVGMLGNRMAVPTEQSWALRARRGLNNYLENVVLFGLIALASVVLPGVSSPETLGAGALLFALGRAFYLPVYLIGVPLLRSVFWIASLVGLGLMVWGVVG